MPANNSFSGSSILTLVVSAIISSNTSWSQVVFFDDFTGATTSLTLDLGSNYSSSFASDQLVIGNSSPGFEVGRAYTTQTWANVDFTISVYVHPSQMAFSGGMVSVFAYGNSSFPDNGYSAELTMVGFTVDDYRLQIRAGSTIVATTGLFNILFDPFGTPDYTAFTLSLSGAFVGTNLVLTADFVPDPSDNPTSLGSATISYTVTSPDLTLSHWGIRQLTGGNTVTAAYDDFTITVVPEPSTWMLLGMGILGLWALRSFRPSVRR